jgi:hypothetical protein
VSRGARSAGWRSRKRLCGFVSGGDVCVRTFDFEGNDKSKKSPGKLHSYGLKSDVSPSSVALGPKV